MDDDLPQLEAELKRLRPVALSPDLWRRVEMDLQPAAVQKKIFPGWAWIALPAAAALAVAAWFSTRQDATPARNLIPVAVAAPTPQFKPVSAENVLLDARDEGYVTLTDGTPARRVRQSYVDTITWKNSTTNASLVWSVPREEVSVVPVRFQ